VSSDWLSEWIEVFARDPRSISEARHEVGSYLDTWGLSAERFSVVLLLSELMTNAVRHGAGPIELSVQLGSGRLRVAVTDQGGGQPALHEPDSHDPSAGGWGLHLIDDTAETWGVETRPGQTTVWFEHHLTNGLETPPGGPSPLDPV
jgi:anti-sigma regulatory factor (Ser/Thr protein kinase)